VSNWAATHPGRRVRAVRGAVVVVAASAVGCLSGSPPTTATIATDTTPPATTTTTALPMTVPVTTAAVITGPPVTEDVAGERRALLARLAIDDTTPERGNYQRDEWKHWLDLDGDGCDAREQALRAASEVPASATRGCTITAGRWTSPYDGRVVTDPAALDVDHLVPLAEADRSGGHAWSTDRRAEFANDPAELVVVSASANRSKGDRAPDRWRPPRRGAWCSYATRWLQVKIGYQLSGTTSERDALGQMLDTCG
jgi:hypothetical protein